MASIRPVRITDCQGMLEIYGPVIEETTTSFEFAVPSLSEFQKRVSKTSARYPWLICHSKGQIVGYAYAGPHRSREAYQWSAELSVYVRAGFQRKGIASALYTAVISLLKDQGYYTALAGISLPNKGSVEFHESLGFKAIGVYHNIGHKFGQWHSVGWWEYPLRAYRSNPKEPLTLPEIHPTSWNKIIKSAEAMIKKQN